MATLIHCAICDGNVSTSAVSCPHCGATPFIPCWICSEPTNDIEKQRCWKHRVYNCYYCGQPTYNEDGSTRIIKWEWGTDSWRDGPHEYSWSSINKFVCNSCANSHPEPPRPRDRKFLGISY